MRYQELKHQIGERARLRLFGLRTKQFVDRNSQCLSHSENDGASAKFSGFFPIREGGLRNAGLFRQFFLRKIAFLTEVLQPGSVGIAASFQFSAHARRMLGAHGIDPCYLATGC